MIQSIFLSVRYAIVLLLFFALLALSSCAPGPEVTDPGVPESSGIAVERSGEDLPNAPSSEAEWEQHVINMQGLATFYEVSAPPAIDVKGWVLPEESGDYVDDCMTGLGYAVTDGSYESIPDAQQSQFQFDRYRCSASYPVIPKYTFAYTDQNIGNIYDWMVEDSIPCLADQGHSISGVPSRATFISNYRASGPFFPYEQLVHLPPAEFQALESICPQWPPAEVIYEQ